jgi:hypothetical protein
LWTVARGRTGFSRRGAGVGGGERNVTSVRARSCGCERPFDDNEVIEASAVRKSPIVAAPDAASSVQGGELRRRSKARLSRLATWPPSGSRTIRTPKSVRTAVFKFPNAICAPFRAVAFPLF